ncbi:uncharacterized protein LOC142984490 [Anticarsia gemmatalis]|uniref:uncharacterized protein LOC142984490 n=1 Tax=Anticarsia gemmatalis TaxID=129554 RepID=UPI003F760147
MGKKVREYKSGDFIFAKVKGYPAWPARVQRLNGKRYFVYFYGTGETANLPPNMIFDYAENKDKFLTKTVKRRDFNDGVKQIEHDFANNVPLEQVIGIAAEEPADSTANDTVNESTANDTMDETAADTTAADETMADDTTLNATANDTGIEDSDDTGTLVIDEGKQKGRKGKSEAKATPKPAKEPKTPRGKAKREEPAKEDDDENKKEEEIVSRSGRKIRPKRYIDEQTEENATLPSPAPKKRRGASPTPDKEKEKSAEPKEKVAEKNIKQFNAVLQSELEDLKEPFKSEDSEKDNILITYLPSGKYVGIKLFQSRPANFKNEAARLQWDKQAASHAVTLKIQLEKGQITSQSVMAQLVNDLNLTDEEKATLDKERETEDKKSRLQFLKTEMKLIELDAKIKSCLCLEKAETDLCLKLLDELMELNIKPLMLLKHPTCLETIKRMRAYVGNTPSWELSESAALVFSKQAHKIRKQADTLYKNMKELFVTPEGLSFWEFFTERVLQFKKVTSKISPDELLELIYEPLEMSTPTPHTMKTAVEAANEEEADKADKPEQNDAAAEETTQNKKSTPAKKKANSTPSKPAVKRQSSRKQQQEDKEKEVQKEDTPKPDQAESTEESQPSNNMDTETTEPVQEESVEKPTESTEQEPEKEAESTTEEKKDDKEESEVPSEKEIEKVQESDKDKEDKADGEPRAKRSRESKKTEQPPPRSPAKRKSKF